MPRDLGCQTPRRQKQRNCSRNYREGEELLSDSLHIAPTELNNEIDKVYRLPLTNKQKQTEKTATPNIICKFKTHSYREKLFSKENELYNNSNKKIKFHVSLTKLRSDLLEKAQNHIRNLQGIKFWFADPNGNLKVKFNDNKNMNFDSLESLGNVIERKLGTEELSNRSIEKCTINMTLTQMILMEVEIIEIRSTVSSGDSYFLLLMSHFFRKQGSRDVLGKWYSGGMQRICGEAHVPECDFNEAAR